MNQEIEHSYLPIRGLKLHIAHIGKGFTHTKFSRHIAGFCAIAPDLPGYGLSEPPSDLAQASWESLIKDLLSILDSLGISKVCLNYEVFCHACIRSLEP